MNYRSQSGTFQFEEHAFSINVQSFAKIMQGILLLMKTFQTKPLVKNMNGIYSDLY